ncbi:putative bifunctional diguanylate cyclase/phosphodiesterase [Paenibacillus sp. GCM10023252]|uniref:putative bifunctional diguanylate cyclase/phosphodiesterase n=1 Tax=Paenibacillus sp. GCM10023252 TaxID=3252649 RepID=UPI00360BBCE9
MLDSRLESSPRAEEQQAPKLFLESYRISLIMQSLAAVWMIGSFMLIDTKVIQWSSMAIGFLILLASLIYAPYTRRGFYNSFRLYHTPLVETLLRSNALPLAVLNEDGTFLEMNEAASRALGYEKAELLGCPYITFAEQASRAPLAEAMKAALHGEYREVSISMLHRSGFPLDVQMTCSPMTSRGKVVGIAIISHDLSDRKRHAERLRYMANYDDMTGLPNRTLFQHMLSEELTKSKNYGNRVGLCYLNVDRFKLVNASYGREYGDMLLMQIAERLASSLTDESIAARMEGDEFVVLYNALQSEEQLIELARILLRRMEEPFVLQGSPIHITVSIGLSLTSGVEEDALALLKKADIALCKVKEGAINDCLLYSDSWNNNSSLERLTLQHEMYRAIQREEFVLHYQPQYDMLTGTIVGVEALVRWHHPQRGIIPPGQFIPLAEESGMIVQIGDWVLEEACRQNKSWQDEGLPPIPVSVNLSIRQFLQHDLARKVEDVLIRTGLSSDYLDLEITESMSMDMDYVSRCLNDLTKLGVGISVDDFGTGYSSFNYLRSFPIDRLKIDRSFLMDIQQVPGDAEIVAAIIAMAHNLNIQVIAEGVETEEQMEFLRAHQCDEMQGYYWSPPVTSAHMADMLRMDA